MPQQDPLLAAVQRRQQRDPLLEAVERRRQQAEEPTATAAGLPPPPDNRSMLERAKDWATSREGGQALAVEIGAPAAAWSGGAMLGGAVAGPVGAAIGGPVAGGVAGYQASKKAQEMRGQPFSRKQALVEAAVSALPPFLSRGKTAGQIIKRQAAKYGALGAGTDVARQAGRASDEGRPITIDPLQTAMSGVGGAVLGGGLSAPGARAQAGRHVAADELADALRRAGPQSTAAQQAAAAEAPKRLTPNAARAAIRTKPGSARKAASRDPLLRKLKQRSKERQAAAAPTAPAAKPPADPIAADAKKLRASQREVKRGLGDLQRELQQHFGPDDLQGSNEKQINRIMAKSRKALTGTLPPEEFEALNRELAMMGMGGDRLTRIANVPSPLPEGRQATVEAAQAAGRAKPGRKKGMPRQLQKTSYTHTPSGDRAAQKKLEWIQQNAPESQPKLEKVFETKTLKGGKTVQVQTGWTITSKYARARAQKVRQIARQAEAADAVAASPQKAAKAAAKAAGLDDIAAERRLAPLEDVGQMPDDVADFLAGAPPTAQVLDEIPQSLPRGSVAEDWQSVPVGTRELAADFAQKARAAGHDVWVQPGAKRRKWTVHVNKEADISELRSEYGVGRPQLPEPGEEMPRQEMPRPGQLGRPDAGVRLASEQPVAAPRSGATLGEQLVAKGQVQARPRMETPPEGLPTAEPAAPARPQLTPEQQQQLAATIQRPQEAPAPRESSIPTEAMRQRAAGMSDEELRTNLQKSTNPAARAAMDAELTQRRADRAPKLREQIEALRGKIQGATSVAAGQLRNRIKALEKRLVEDETGALWIHGPKDQPPPPSLDDPRLDRVLAEGQASMEGRAGQPKTWQQKKQRMLQRWYDADWAVRDAVHEAVTRFNVLWSSKENPLHQLRLIKGGKWKARVENAWNTMVDTYRKIHEQKLDKPFLEYMHLSTNLRLERGAIQHVLNARPKYDAAVKELADAKAAGAKKREIARLERRVGFAEKELTAAEKTWGRIERGKGLSGGFKPGESEAALNRLKELQSPENLEKIEAATKTFAELHDRSLTEAVELGIISPEMAAQYRARGEYLAPSLKIQGKLNDFINKKFRNFSDQKLLGVRDAALLQEFSGSGQAAEHPVIASMLRIAQVHRQNWENDLTRTFIDGFRKVPGYERAVVQVKPGATIDTENLAKVPLWRNGREEWWTLPRDLAEAVVVTNRMQLDGVDGVLNTARQWLTRSTTTWSPAFLVWRNPPRDIGASRLGLAPYGAFTLGSPTDYVRHWWGYAKAVKDQFQHPKRPVADITEFQESGAAFSTFQQNMQPEAFIGKRQMDRILGIEAGKGEKIFDMVVRTTSQFASALETASKLVSYRRLRQLGYSEDAAAYLARTYGGSPDFAVGGEMKPMLDNLIMFANPTMRGLEHTVMSVKNHMKLPARLPSGKPSPDMLKGAVREIQNEGRQLLGGLAKVKGPRYINRVLGTMMATTAGLAAWNHRDEFYDENGESYLTRIPDYDREANHIIFLPGGFMWETDTGPMPAHLKWAKTHFEVAVQTPMDKLLMARGYGEQSDFADASAPDLLAGVLEGASPIQVSLGDSGKGLAVDIALGISSSANPLIGIWGDVFGNVRSRTGGPIVGRRMAEERSEFRISDRGLQGLQKGISAVGQQARGKLGWDLGIPPAVVDYMAYRLAPGLHQLGTAIERGSGARFGAEGFRGTEFNPAEGFAQKLPIVGAIIRAALGPTGQPDQRLVEARNEFYDYLDKATATWQSAVGAYERAGGDQAGLDAAEQFLMNEAAPMELPGIRRGLERATQRLAAVHRERGQTLIKMRDMPEGPEKQELREKIRTYNNQELTALRQFLRDEVPTINEQGEQQLEQMRQQRRLAPPPEEPAAPDIRISLTPPGNASLQQPVADDPRSMASRLARQIGVEPRLVTAVVQAESNFDPRAESGVGAQGLMQLMPATARSLGVEDPLDPEQNLRGGITYLRQLLQQFGSIELALAAYNAGPTNVRRYGGIPPFPETQQYVQKVMSMMEMGQADD